MVKLGWIEKKILVQIWKEECYQQKIESAKELGIDSFSLPVSLNIIYNELTNPYLGKTDDLLSEGTHDLIALQFNSRRLYRDKFYNAIRSLEKKRLLVHIETKIGKGVKLTKEGKKMAQLLWLQNREMPIFKHALLELEEKGLRFVSAKELLNQIWEIVKAYDVNKEAFEIYWNLRRVGICVKKLGIKSKLVRMYDIENVIVLNRFK